MNLVRTNYIRSMRYDGESNTPGWLPTRTHDPLTSYVAVLFPALFPFH